MSPCAKPMANIVNSMLGFSICVDRYICHIQRAKDISKIFGGATPT